MWMWGIYSQEKIEKTPFIIISTMERIESRIADPRYIPWNPLIATSQAMHWRWKYRKHIFHPFDHKTNAINHRFPIHISFEIRCCVPTGHHTASTIHNQTRHTSFHWITKFLDAKHATFLFARESANYYRIRGVKVTDCTSFYNPLGEFPTPTWSNAIERVYSVVFSRVFAIGTRRTKSTGR